MRGKWLFERRKRTSKILSLSGERGLQRSFKKMSCPFSTANKGMILTTPFHELRCEAQRCWLWSQPFPHIPYLLLMSFARKGSSIPWSLDNHFPKSAAFLWPKPKLSCVLLWHAVSHLMRWAPKPKHYVVFFDALFRIWWDGAFYPPCLPIWSPSQSPLMDFGTLKCSGSKWEVPHPCVYQLDFLP